MQSPLKRTSARRIVAVAATTGACLLGLGAAPAAADAPIESSGSVTFIDINPCTATEMEVTINLDFAEHHHRNNFVGHVSRTGTTDDGYVMDHGVENFVDNGNVARGAFSDIWRHPDGSKFVAQGGFVFDIVNGEPRVERFSLRCIGR